MRSTWAGVLVLVVLAVVCTPSVAGQEVATGQGPACVETSSGSLPSVKVDPIYCAGIAIGIVQKLVGT